MAARRHVSFKYFVASGLISMSALAAAVIWAPIEVAGALLIGAMMFGVLANVLFYRGERSRQLQALRAVPFSATEGQLPSSWAPYALAALCIIDTIYLLLALLFVVFAEPTAIRLASGVALAITPLGVWVQSRAYRKLWPRN